MTCIHIKNVIKTINYYACYSVSKASCDTAMLSQQLIAGNTSRNPHNVDPT